MTRPALCSIVSGRFYPVVAAAAGEPAALTDFVGETRFAIDLDGDPYDVCGFGRLVDRCVRFYQKESEGAGRDVRVWSVHERSDSPGFIASHVTL